jgi:cell wall-associated NlpC family hydrolase
MAFPVWVNNYIGIPYLFGGDTLDGADCWGLVRIILRNEYKKELPDYYHDDPLQHRVAQLVKSSLATAPVDKTENPEPGDIVLLKIIGFPCHIGIVAGNGFMVHTLHGHDSALESYTGSKWSKRMEGFYRVR